MTLTTTERRTNDDQESQLDAYALARTGMERYIGNRAALGFTSVPPAAFESTTVTLTGGRAHVVLRQVRPPVDSTVPGLYVLWSRGVSTKKSVSGAPDADRTVAQYVRWQYATMEVKSAWTSMSGLAKNGGSGTLSGVDACGAKSAVAGVAVPNNPGYVQTGGTSVPTGTPPILEMGTTNQTKEAVKVDWNAIVNGYAIVPDVELPDDSYPSSTDFSDPDFWPVIRVNGDYSLPADGRGTLIVTGNLIISGALNWRGIILVGGTLTANGNNTVTGAVISGLNIELGMTVAASDVGNGTKTYQYSSCDVDSAVNGFRGLVPYRNASVDNWPTPT